MARLPVIMFLIIIFAFVFLVVEPVNLMASQLAAEIIYTKGSVKIKAASVNDWIAGQVGMSLKEGDTIRTESGSSAELAFGDGLKNVINVFPDSQLIISKSRPGLLRLEQGRVFALIKKLDKGSAFEVRTPTAVAGARGTGWGMSFVNDLTHIMGFERTIYAAGLNDDGSFNGLKDIVEGWQALIAKGQGPGDLSRLTREEKMFWRTWKNQILSHLRRYLIIKRRLGGNADLKEIEKLARILERVERETTRTDEIKRQRRSQGGKSQNPFTFLEQ